VSRLGEHVSHRGPKAQRTVTDGEHGGGHPPAAAVAQQLRPLLGGSWTARSCTASPGLA
jgi:hypothetical protein